jgi:hypothetical protein
MRPALLLLPASSSLLWLLACSAPGTDAQPAAPNVGGQVGSTGGISGAFPSGAGGAANAGVAGVLMSGGSPHHAAGTGGAVAGAPVAAGMHAGGGVGAAGGGGSAGGGVSAAGGGSAGSNGAACKVVQSEYAVELDKQLLCNPNAGSQCSNRVAAAPGCECRVFIQPSDPFAIEHLSNVANGWFDHDCSMPSCPAKCSTAAVGTCQPDPKSSLGGRCLTP